MSLCLPGNLEYGRLTSTILLQLTQVSFLPRSLLLSQLATTCTEWESLPCFFRKMGLTSAKPSRSVDDSTLDSLPFRSPADEFNNISLHWCSSCFLSSSSPPAALLKALDL